MSGRRYRLTPEGARTERELRRAGDTTRPVPIIDKPRPISPQQQGFTAFSLTQGLEPVGPLPRRCFPRPAISPKNNRKGR